MTQADSKIDSSRDPVGIRAESIRADSIRAESIRAVSIRDLHFAYGSRMAIDGLSLEIEPGEIFGLLGPNGSGKSTLFRVVSTLIRKQQGTVEIFGKEIAKQRAEVRGMLGVVFQSPSLDRKLTVQENLRCQGALHGLSRTQTEIRVIEVLEALGLSDRKKEFVERLSGGMKRRVELAKGMLHHPRLFLMDEPSTGLDPAARLDFWHCLDDLRNRHGATILLTTHLLEEAEKCDRIGILHQGKLVALGSPESLRQEAGDALLTITCQDAKRLAEAIRLQFGLEVIELGNQIRVARPDVLRWVEPLGDAFRDHIETLTVARPSLEDVFIAKTGHTFWDQP